MPNLRDLNLSEDLLRNEPDALDLLVKETELADDVCCHLAREDPNLYSEYVFGQRQHPYHELLQNLANQHDRLCIDAPIEHGKTTQFDVCRTTWLLGRNPNELIGIFSNSSVIPERAVRTVKETIEGNPAYARVFPHAHIVKSNAGEIWMRRPAGTLKDPSLVGMGIMGSIIGSRLTFCILDDILDFQNTFSEGERKKLWDLINSTILNRLIANGRLIDIGTPWHVEDARHKLRKMPGYTFVHFDAENGATYKINGEIAPIPGGQVGTLWNATWIDPITGHPYGWPAERLAARKEAMSSVPHEYARQFRCIALSGSMAVFAPEALAYAKSLGKQRFYPGTWFTDRSYNNGRVRVTTRKADVENAVIVSGVDLAVKKSDAADKTAIYTMALNAGSKELLEICVGQMEVPEIVEHVLRVVRQYPGHRSFRVEDNGAQAYLVQVLGNSDIMRALGARTEDLQRINVRPHTTTGKNKTDPVVGIRGMSLYFAQGKWPIPCDDRERCPGLVEEWYDSMVAFDPTGHTNDILMASWLAAEEARSFGDGASTMWGKYGMFVG